MTWIKIIFLVLKIADMLLSSARENKWIKIGEDREIAKQLAEISRKAGISKQVMQEISGLSDDKLDERLRELEPK